MTSTVKNIKPAIGFPTFIFIDQHIFYQYPSHWYWCRADCICEDQTIFWHPYGPICICQCLTMPLSYYVMPVINAIDDYFDMFGMGVKISFGALGIQSTNLNILKKYFKNCHFRFFLCILKNFLCINEIIPRKTLKIWTPNSFTNINGSDIYKKKLAAGETWTPCPAWWNFYFFTDALIFFVKHLFL